MNRPGIGYDWPSTNLPAPSDPDQLTAHPCLPIVNATELTRVIAVGRAEVQHWTDIDGRPRQTLRIVCDELSPSLRWAQVTVTRGHRQ